MVCDFGLGCHLGRDTRQGDDGASASFDDSLMCVIWHEHEYQERQEKHDHSP